MSVMVFIQLGNSIFEPLLRAGLCSVLVCYSILFVVKFN